ncbi:helix-turn-helix transcriptional regulator [Curtobacterium flaccumfaciens]|uniref:helix-turn-helix transcriptional regulator n=1 Tax=Curtobacterium flaccumfaciens TaxID=2035 RepID=UPI001266C0ED|nr:helix-turn-helix transcriptional regulator [Curtobacterium flaccumfaciens]MBT1665641.1 helix-turn-helix domain-containing protein [Curtobacterium flaccumfaciens pv. flaccumfaciens]
MSTDQVEALGDLLRSWRRRLTPEDVGMESYGRRRTPGLRREELAQLAGVSADYVMRLEQGRSRTPSAQVVQALARALQLDRAETDLFHRAAGLASPRAGVVSRHIPPGVQRMLVRMGDLPLAVFAADWTLLHSTPLWQALFDAPSVRKDPEQNLIVQTFLDNGVAEIATALGGPEPFERALVADLRRTAGSLGGDPAFRAFIVRLRTESERFAGYWDEGRAAAHQSLVKTVHNPIVGDVVLDCDVVTVPDSDIKLVVYSTPESGPDADKLDFLRVRAVRAADVVGR